MVGGGGAKIFQRCYGVGAIFFLCIRGGGALFFSPIDFANHPPPAYPAINNERSFSVQTDL